MCVCDCVCDCVLAFLRQVGDRVTGEGHIVCGYCRNCRGGRQHLCRNTEGVGVTRPGSCPPAFAHALCMCVYVCECVCTCMCVCVCSSAQTAALALCCVSLDRAGAFADYFALPASNAFKLPDAISDETAAIMDPLGNAVG